MKPRLGPVDFPAVPEGKPDFVSEEHIPGNAGIMYRIHHGRNPLHIDPEVSRLAGYEQPIIHGLCWMGHTVRAVQQHFFKDDPSLMQSMTVRFASHVFPGDTLVISAWKVGHTIIFTTATKQRGLTCLRGCIEVSQSMNL